MRVRDVKKGSWQGKKKHQKSVRDSTKRKKRESQSEEEALKEMRQNMIPHQAINQATRMDNLESRFQAAWYSEDVRQQKLWFTAG